jgi:MFS family permease
MPVRIIFHKRPVFWVFIAVLMLQNLSYVPVSLYLPTYAASLGASRTNGNLSLSAFNIASTLSRFSFGYLTDRHSYIHITVVATVTASLITFLVWGWAKDLALLLVFAIAYGLFAGGFSSSWSPAARDLSWPDQQQNSSLFGLFGAVKGLAAVVGPLTAAKLYDPLAQRQDYG